MIAQVVCNTRQIKLQSQPRKRELYAHFWTVAVHAYLHGVAFSSNGARQACKAGHAPAGILQICKVKLGTWRQYASFCDTASPVFHSAFSGLGDEFFWLAVPILQTYDTACVRSIKILLVPCKPFPGTTVGLSVLPDCRSSSAIDVM